MAEDETMRKYAEAHGFEIGNEQYVCPRPLPCVRDERGVFKEQTIIKQLIAKVDEELNEMKEAVYFNSPGNFLVNYIKPEAARERIAEEAADTITAITTMLEALGIDAEMRDEAQRRINAKNRERGRL